MVQAIDRLRLIHSPRKKTVIILCNIPLDLPVDELVTWRELAGDDRLAEALETCDENGWEALPLEPAELTRLFPELWATEKAAERWFGNNPQNPRITITRGERRPALRRPIDALVVRSANVLLQIVSEFDRVRRANMLVERTHVSVYLQKLEMIGSRSPGD